MEFKRGDEVIILEGLYKDCKGQVTDIIRSNSESRKEGRVIFYNIEVYAKSALNRYKSVIPSQIKSASDNDELLNMIEDNV